VHADLGVARLMVRYGERRNTWALSVPLRPADDRAFSRAFEHQMSRYDRGARTDVKVVLSAAMGVPRDHGLRPDPQLILALKARAQSSGSSPGSRRRTVPRPDAPAAPPGPAGINNETAQPVLAIGADPPRRLHRWRVAGELCGCRGRDLHFSLSESRGLGHKRRSGFALTQLHATSLLSYLG
jgi:hypothetical protein